MEAIKINSKYVTLKLTHEEAEQLIQLCTAANADGDHKEWMISAQSTKKELAALDSVYEKVISLRRIL
jgi:hypothetical protein